MGQWSVAGSLFLGASKKWQPPFSKPDGLPCSMRTISVDPPASTGDLFIASRDAIEYDVFYLVVIGASLSFV